MKHGLSEFSFQGPGRTSPGQSPVHLDWRQDMHRSLAKTSWFKWNVSSFPLSKEIILLEVPNFHWLPWLLEVDLISFWCVNRMKEKKYANRYRECQPVWWNSQYSQLAERTLSKPKKNDIRIENKVFKKRSLTSRATSYTYTIWTGHDTTGLWEPSDDLTNMIPKISHPRSRCQRFQNSWATRGFKIQYTKKNILQGEPQLISCKWSYSL